MAIRVLLVDDVTDLRDLFRHALSHDGRIIVIAEAADGIEAIEKAAELNPDVILLDLAMPRLDGLRAIPRLHEASPGTRILVLSGFSSPKIAARAVASCATGFIAKGIPPSELGNVIEQVYRSPAKSGCSKTPA